MVYEWLNRDAKRVDDGWSSVLEDRFSIPHDQFMGAWMAQPGTILLWSRQSGDLSALDPTRLCPVRLDDADVARFSSKP
jgi:hypothetical protein